MCRPNPDFSPGSWKGWASAPPPWPWRPPGFAWDSLEPDGIHPSGVHHAPDREVRWRRYDAQVVEIVVDLIDDTIASAWITRVDA